MASFQQEPGLLKAAHRQADPDLWFYDQTGLGLNPTGCMPGRAKASRPKALPAQRGQGFGIAGFLTLENQLHAYSYSGPTSSKAFIPFVDEWINQHPPERKTVLVLDSAAAADRSFHRSADVVARCRGWARHLVYLQYLPAYGSELNLIELLWHRLKHE